MTTRRLIANRLENLNKLQDVEYYANFADEYGGWEMHEYGTGATRALGFNYRLPSKEFLAYLDGCLAVLRGLKNNY